MIALALEETRLIFMKQLEVNGALNSGALLDEDRRNLEEEGSRSWRNFTLGSLKHMYLVLFIYVLYVFPEVRKLITVVASGERIWGRTYFLLYSQLDGWDFLPCGYISYSQSKTCAVV